MAAENASTARAVLNCLRATMSDNRDRTDLRRIFAPLEDIASQIMFLFRGEEAISRMKRTVFSAAPFAARPLNRLVAFGSAQANILSLHLHHLI